MKGAGDTPYLVWWPLLTTVRVPVTLAAVGSNVFIWSNDHRNRKVVSVSTVESQAIMAPNSTKNMLRGTEEGLDWLIKRAKAQALQRTVSANSNKEFTILGKLDQPTVPVPRRWREDPPPTMKRSRVDSPPPSKQPRMDSIPSVKRPCVELPPPTKRSRMEPPPPEKRPCGDPPPPKKRSRVNKASAALRSRVEPPKPMNRPFESTRYDRKPCHICGRWFSLEELKTHMKTQHVTCQEADPQQRKPHPPVNAIPTLLSAARRARPGVNNSVSSRQVSRAFCAASEHPSSQPASLPPAEVPYDLVAPYERKSTRRIRPSPLARGSQLLEF